MEVGVVGHRWGLGGMRGRGWGRETGREAVMG